jgi:hypothetical protein
MTVYINLGFVRENKMKIWKLILFQTIDKNKYTNFVKSLYNGIPAGCLRFSPSLDPRSPPL